jgi:hypothetical protein
VAPEVQAQADELFDSFDEIEEALKEKWESEARAPAKPAPIDEEADRARAERCRKMLSFARVLDEDRKALDALIGTGISAHDFGDEIKKAVEKRKNREAEEARTAAQKAAIVEEEVLEELMSLDDDIEEEDLEDMILADLDRLDKELNQGK